MASFKYPASQASNIIFIDHIWQILERSEYNSVLSFIWQYLVLVLVLVFLDFWVCLKCFWKNIQAWIEGISKQNVALKQFL